MGRAHLRRKCRALLRAEPILLRQRRARSDRSEARFLNGLHLFTRDSVMGRARKQAGPKDFLSELWPSQRSENSVALLKALHILSRDGALNADSRRKLKQVLHLTQLLRPFLDAL